MSYGLPYQGSKSRIAKWIIDTLPNATTFVDLMAGGCAVTHAAILSGKYEHFIANDICSGPKIFLEAMQGELDKYSLVADREEFFSTKDPLVKMLYSFGNDQRTYAYGKEAEAVKIPAMKMLSAPSLHERRMHYRQFIHALYHFLEGGNYKKKLIGDNKSSGGLLSLQSLEALERCQKLKDILADNDIKISNEDYRLVDIPFDAVVYCDPPL